VCVCVCEKGLFDMCLQKLLRISFLWTGSTMDLDGIPMDMPFLHNEATIQVLVETGGVSVSVRQRCTRRTFSFLSMSRFRHP
jgi:hypothetical protein